jgi:hypothetical protein
VETELNGPGKLLGYRAMHKKIRQEHGLNITRDQVYNVMNECDPEGLEARSVGGKKKRKTLHFTTKGKYIIRCNTTRECNINKIIYVL